MTRRLPDVAEVTSADVDSDAVLVRSESRGFVRGILLKHLFGALPLLRGSTALQKLGALVVRGDGNSDLAVGISGSQNNGTGRGARLAVGGNRNEDTPAPGVWRLQDASGAWCTLYVDDNGVLRITRAAEVNALNPRPGRDVREEAGFELHDGVTTERTTIADSDRFFFSDESEAGQPHRYIEADDLRADIGLRESFPTDSVSIHYTGSGHFSTRVITVAHNLGVIPKMIMVHLTTIQFTGTRLLGPVGWYFGETTAFNL